MKKIVEISKRDAPFCRRVLRANQDFSFDLPEKIKHLQDIRLSENILEYYIDLFTPAEGVVFDPFLGYGTTIRVAERMNRVGFGVEIDAETAEFVSRIVSTRTSVLNADIRSVDLASIPKIDLCVSSPPFMNRTDPEDPLSGYTAPLESYESYVRKLAEIYVRIGEHLSSQGRIAIQVQNLINERGTTSLAFDLHAAIGERLIFEGEDLLLWNERIYGFDHGYMFVYQRRR